jgi:hypothetical protein
MDPLWNFCPKDGCKFNGRESETTAWYRQHGGKREIQLSKLDRTIILRGLELVAKLIDDEHRLLVDELQDRILDTLNPPEKKEVLQQIDDAMREFDKEEG